MRVIFVGVDWSEHLWEGKSESEYQPARRPGIWSGDSEGSLARIATLPR